ncbi:unnamed protein product [Cylicocyclus nassatus]|uniref:Aminopeptidase N-like N-terminal domain-containing protein n=1 Tax=Cylicocyclus nassatus TaxID=53992 RepID=A0AA36GQQ6_CYLNA|nr:unnamed protein product [Cylicocyclus nassatus]
MSDSVKKQKSSFLLYLLIAASVLVLLCAATILYLVLNGGKPEVVQELPSNATSSQLFLVPEPNPPPAASSIIPTSTTPAPRTIPVRTTTVATTAAQAVLPSSINRDVATTPTTTTVTQTSTTTSTTSTSTTSSTSSTTSSTSTTPEPEVFEETTIQTEFEEPEPTQEITDAPTTQEIAQISQAMENSKVVDKCSSILLRPVTCPKTRDDVITLSLSALSPIHYSLNLSIQSVMPTVLDGDVQIYIRTNVAGKQITLDVDNELRHVEDISVVNCDNGETLCVTKTVFDQREQRLSLILFENVQSNTNLRVDVRKFTSVSNRDATYAQIAPRWNRNAPIMVGSLLTPGSAKKIFPALDSPAYKASLDLCVKFTPSGHVRSNAATKSVVEGVTCFERSVPLSTQQMAFAAFEKAESLIYNRTTLDGVTIPAVEIVFSLNKNFKREKHEWIYNEASKVISLMSQWTSFPYPLEALKLVSAPIRASSHSALGLITLQDRLVEHPSYTLAHVSLIQSVIQQWLSGIISMSTAEESCFAESLTTYLEWKLNEQVGIVNKTRAGEIEAIRPRDLTAEGRDEPRMLRSLETMQSCPERFVSIFYSIDETFGQDTMINVLKLVFRKFAYSVTNIADWQQALVDSTGNYYAGQMLSEWFTRKTRPILHLQVKSLTLQFEQLTDELWTVPVEVAGSSGIQLVAVTDKTVTLPYSSLDYVIADPRRKSGAMIVQDVDSYVRMIRCWDDSRCPASHEALRGIIRDLGAVVLTNKLAAPEIHDVPKWKAVFKFARMHRILDGNAACCAEYAISRTADIACTWVVRDTCEKIALVNTVAGV